MSKNRIIMGALSSAADMSPCQSLTEQKVTTVKHFIIEKVNKEVFFSHSLSQNNNNFETTN